MIINECPERAGNPEQVKLQAGQARNAVAVGPHEPLVSDWLFFLLNKVDQLAIALVATLQVVARVGRSVGAVGHATVEGVMGEVVVGFGPDLSLRGIPSLVGPIVLPDGRCH